jgi:hypothetical protein
MKATVLIIRTKIAAIWKNFLAGEYLFFTALCCCTAITYLLGANQGKVIVSVAPEGIISFKQIPADTFPVFMVLSIFFIIIVAHIHAIVIKKKMWDNPVTQLYPSILFAVWLAISIFSWLPLLWIIILFLVIKQDIKKANKQKT